MERIHYESKQLNVRPFEFFNSTYLFLRMQDPIESKYSQLSIIFGTSYIGTFLKIVEDNFFMDY